MVGRSVRRGAAALLASLAALTACTGGGSDAPTSGTTTTVPTTTGTSSADTGPVPMPTTPPQHPLPAEKEIVDTPGLRADVTMTRCRATTTGWSADGTAKNTGTRTATYHVLVFFTDSYGRAVDSAATDVEVAAGKSGKWIAARDFDPPAGTKCVLRAVSRS